MSAKMKDEFSQYIEDSAQSFNEGIFWAERLADFIREYPQDFIDALVSAGVLREKTVNTLGPDYKERFSHKEYIVVLSKPPKTKAQIEHEIAEKVDKYFSTGGLNLWDGIRFAWKEWLACES